MADFKELCFDANTLHNHEPYLTQIALNSLPCFHGLISFGELAVHIAWKKERENKAKDFQAPLD